MNELSLNTRIKDINLINNIYDEELIGLINSLSSSIKDYFHNYKLYLSNFKTQSDSINEQTLFSKSAINDILLYLNQSKPKLSVNTSEKYIREKVYLISERMDKMNELKKNMAYNVKHSEMMFMTFYDEAIELFNKIKLVRSHKINEINAKLNYEEYMGNRKEKSNSLSPNNKITINRKQNNTSTQLNSSFNSSQRVDSFNTFGSNPSYGAVNPLSVSVDDIIRKNENLISEIALIKYKYGELTKENQYLRNIIMKQKQEQNNLLNISGNKDNFVSPKENHLIENAKVSSSTHTKSRSLPKKKNYPACNTIGNEPEKDKININDLSNKREFKEGNPMQLSVSSSKEAKLNTKHKRAYSIDNNKESKKSSQNQNRNQNQIQNPLLISGNSAYSMDQNGFKTMSNSNSVNNNLCMSLTANCGTINSSLMNNSTLATLVLSFLSQMKSLQESISNHSDNIKEMKKGFELKKRELTKLSEAIIDSSINSLQNNVSQVCTQQSITKKQTHPPSKTHNDLTKLEAEITQLKSTNTDLEKKVKNEKGISALCEDKLNEEKTKNKTMSESLDVIQSKLKEMTKLTEDQKGTIDVFEKSNKELTQIVQNYKERDTLLNKDIELIKDKYDSLQKDSNFAKSESTKLSNENKALSDEITTAKTEIAKLKTTLSESSQNMLSISKTNEVILTEKDNIIKNMSNNTSELKKEIDALSNDLLIKKEKIASLQSELNSIQVKTKENINSQVNNDNKEISSLRETINQYKKDYNDSKKDNKELMNRIADLKTNYSSFNEEKDNLKQMLIEFNYEAESNIKEIQAKNKKLQSYKEEYSSKLHEKTKETVLNELKSSSEEYINTLSLIKNYNKDMDKLNKALDEKIQMSLMHKKNEIESSMEPSLKSDYNKEMKMELDRLTAENDKMKNMIIAYQGKESQNNNNPNKTLSDINDQNSNFINDDEISSVSGIFLEDKKDDIDKNQKAEYIEQDSHNKNNIIITNTKSTHQKQCISLPNIVHSEQISLERKHSQSSLHSNDEAKYLSTLKMLEENETLFRNQLTTLKTELKSTIEERNELKKKCDEASTVLNKEELFKILRQTFEKLIDLIQVVGKVKDYVMMILKLLNYTDDEIQKIITKKDKKTLFGIFK